jgi:CheY-like chemotaxis protein
MLTPGKTGHRKYLGIRHRSTACVLRFAKNRFDRDGGPMSLRVLVVEDNDDWRAIMALFLTRLGYKVLQATNGLEAVEKATGELPHLILMDLKLPKLSGLEATAQIKKNPATTDIPVVLCTAFGPEAYASDPTMSCLAEVVQKPIKLDAFQALIQKHLPLPGSVAAPRPA